MNVIKRMWTAAVPAWRCLMLSALLLAAGCATRSNAPVIDRLRARFA